MNTRILSSGYTRISINAMIWAQIPPGEVLRRCHCFQPEWSYERLRKATEQQQEKS